MAQLAAALGSGEAAGAAGAAGGTAAGTGAAAGTAGAAGAAAGGLSGLVNQILGSTGGTEGGYLQSLGQAVPQGVEMLGPSQTFAGALGNVAAPSGVAGFGQGALSGFTHGALGQASGGSSSLASPYGAGNALGNYMSQRFGGQDPNGAALFNQLLSGKKGQSPAPVAHALNAIQSVLGNI